MNIVVLVKQVPDTETKIKIKADGSGIETDGIKWVMNPYDEYAVEEALKIKEAGKADEVTILSMGPDRAIEAIRTGLAMGADKAIHVKVDSLDGMDALTTAQALAKGLDGVEYGLIVCGKQAMDDDQSAVPAMLCELLGIPQVTVVSKVEVGEGTVTVNRDIEGGAKMVIEAPLPALVAATKGLNEPRYASLPGIMKAKRKPVDVKNFADLGVEPVSKTEIIGWSLPDERAAGKVINTGDREQNVKELVRLLREEAKVI
ncbi:MAG: electron transfer flavoprotein subunit beta/FixA family protein [Candidatus Alcyoniella australis]|nr:electron transfer flavoprotein subunit beta/FixA family protein [Candidatus Alcyoniella australis]